MTESPVTPVAGYRPQTEEALALVNRNKRTEEGILREMDSLKRALGDTAAVDQRWLAIARTKLEEAYMAYNRAIMRPGRIEGAL